MRKYFFKKYSYQINRECRGILDFCSFIVFYILYFCGLTFLPTEEVKEFVGKEFCKLKKLFFILNEKKNKLIINGKYLLNNVNNSLREQNISYNNSIN